MNSFYQVNRSVVPGSTGPSREQLVYVYVPFLSQKVVAVASVATLRAWYRLQKPLNPENTKKIQNPPSRVGARKRKKLPEKYKTCPKITIFVFFRYFFRIFGPRPGKGDFVFFVVIFSYFRDSGVFVICARPAGSQSKWPKWMLITLKFKWPAKGSAS